MIQSNATTASCARPTGQSSHWKAEFGHRLKCQEYQQQAAEQEEAKKATTPISDDEEEAPSHLCCPITTEVFVDPVICTDGETYEKSAILQWIVNRQKEMQSARQILKYSKNNKSAMDVIKAGVRSPMLGGKLESFKLTPNRVIRRLADEWREQVRSK